jgi:hypothetical protein
MPAYTGGQSLATPSVTVSNWTLEAETAGDHGRVRQVSWGGEVTTSIAMNTRWVRPTTAGVGAGTAIVPGDITPGYSTPLIELYSDYATTPPVIPSADVGELYVTSWNCHGGMGILVLAPGTTWEIINGLLADSITCRNAVGTSASSYALIWEE